MTKGCLIYGKDKTSNKFFTALLMIEIKISGFLEARNFFIYNRRSFKKKIVLTCNEIVDNSGAGI